MKEFLNKLSSKIQALIEDEATENSEAVLESEEIFFGSLNHTIASLSTCKVTDVSKDPPSVLHVNCHVFLDRAPSWLCSSRIFPESGKNSGELCSECAGDSYLMRVFNEVKHSSGTIDLGRPAMTARSGVSSLVDMDDLTDNDECLEPTDLSVRKVTMIAVAMETIEDPQSIVDLKSRASEIKMAKSSKDVGIQACVKPVKKKYLKGNQILGKRITAKPIRRKHRGYPLEKFLLKKVERMRQRLLELNTELAEKEQSPSTSEPELLPEALVPSSSNDQQPPAVTVASFKIDGTTAIVPSMESNPVENENWVALASSSDAGKNGTGKPFECPMEGCSTLCIFIPTIHFCKVT